MSVQNAEFTHEDEEGVSIVTFSVQVFVDQVQIIRIRNGLAKLIDGGVRRLVLDFRNVTYLNVQIYYVLIPVGSQLSLYKKFKRPSEPKWERYQICADRQTAIAAIADADSDPLILCDVRPDARYLFKYPPKPG